MPLDGFVGSNPTPCTRITVWVVSGTLPLNGDTSGPHSSVVERILGKNEVPSSILGVGSKLSTNQYKRLIYKRMGRRPPVIGGVERNNGKASI